jgi:hypothetical protein
MARFSLDPEHAPKLAPAEGERLGHLTARLRDLEQGRTHADSALLAYLTVIEKDPEAVRRALGG